MLHSLRPPSRSSASSTQTHTHTQTQAHTQSQPQTQTQTQTQTTTTTTNARPSSSRGVLSQLKLRPRQTAVFAVRLTIHDVAAVPLVHGEFAVRWKIEHHRPARRVVSGGNSNIDKDKHGDNTERSSYIDHGDHDDGYDRNNDADDYGGGIDNNSTDTHSNSNSAALAIFVSPPTFNTTDISAASKAHADSVLGRCSTESAPVNGHTEFPHTAAEAPPGNLKGHTESAPAKGQTEWAVLKDHTAAWEHTLEFIVHVSVNRDKGSGDGGTLAPCDAKFVVMQVRIRVCGVCCSPVVSLVPATPTHFLLVSIYVPAVLRRATFTFHFLSSHTSCNGHAALY
ncbi:hypothetical protein BJ138DRAFT_1163222 [Hygrophoropsis aurantiaca]|uniref:Uncharacterized protein n=1 Tax=Hygrophoropsis aurantiaca TaxID=72124 RepID=A0ACB7ZZL6_9AGAM|nr:hypothetical protein BJ138DRAFT_1163222 [Hygrophoropsis aurantiaca]